MTRKLKIAFVLIAAETLILFYSVHAESGQDIVEKSSGGSMIENLLLVLSSAFIIYVFFIRPGKSSFKKAMKSHTVQELLYYKEITPDGLVILPDGKYRRMVEIYPTNLILKSPEEQANCWGEYRNTIDTLPVDWTKVIQSRIMLISDYLDEQALEAEKLKEKYPLLYKHQKQVIDELRNEYEEKEKRERRYFIIFRFDAEDFLHTDSAFGIDNAAAGAMFSSLGLNRKKYSDEELRNVAAGELDNAASLLAAGLYRSGVAVRLMNKMDILDYLNNTLCRDIAPVHNIDLIDRAGVFHFTPASITVDLFLSKQAIEEACKSQREEDTENGEFYYEDEFHEFGEGAGVT